jgi:kinesin family protein 4/21/27
MKNPHSQKTLVLQILKEEVHDLLDPNPPTEIVNGGHGGGTSAPPFGGGSKIGTMKPPIQIRETSNGGITLAGVTESDVNSLNEMATCLETGSLCRATGSTNMNSSSRSVSCVPSCEDHGVEVVW